MITVTVFGSCVCRDLFKNYKECCEIKTDIRFVSPFSAVEKDPLYNCSLTDFSKPLDRDNGNWFKKNLINDINKTCFSAIKENHGEFLILDLAEARLQLIEFLRGGCSTIITKSSIFERHFHKNLSKTVFKNSEYRVINPLDIDINNVELMIKEFAERLLEIFPAKNIILIKTKPANYYLTKNKEIKPYFRAHHLTTILKCNILNEKLNNLFLKYCKNCNVIEMPSYLLGNELQEWGHHPLHFTDNCYNYLYKKVDEILSKTKHTEEIENLKEILMDEYTQAEKKTIYNNLSLNRQINYEEILSGDDFKNIGKRRKKLILFILKDKKFKK